jgi:hypothetical protein
MTTMISPETDYIIADGDKIPFTLREIDRADCCSVRALYKVTLRTGGELLFCKHHYTKHELALSQYVVKTIDESLSLTRKS